MTVTISRLLGCSFGVISCLVVGQAWAAEDGDEDEADRADLSGDLEQLLRIVDGHAALFGAGIERAAAIAGADG